MKRKKFRAQIKKAHNSAIEMLCRTIELMNAKKELVKAETELERVRKAGTPLAEVVAHINRNPNFGNGIAAHYAGEKLRELVEEARLRQTKIVVSESTAQSYRDLNARMKALEDQVRNFKVKEEPKPEEPEKKEPIKPEMRLVEKLELNKTYLAVSKEDSGVQVIGVFAGIKDGILVNLQKEGEDQLLSDGLWYFFEFVTSEPKEEPQSEPLYYGIEKARLIKSLESALGESELLCKPGRNLVVLVNFRIKQYDLERLIKELKQ